MPKWFPSLCALELLLLLLQALAPAAEAQVTQRRAVCNATSHYECGLQVGTQMRGNIERFLQGSASIAPMRSWLASPNGSARLDLYLAAHESQYPELVSEVRGLAEGAAQERGHNDNILLRCHVTCIVFSWSVRS